MLVDKMLFMVPEDQARLRDCMRHGNFLDQFLALATDHAETSWFQANVAAFLETCDLFAKTAAQHHDQLVNRFITIPAQTLDEQHLSGVTASGPPLDVLLRSLEMLRDLRTATARPDLKTRHADLARLRAYLKH